MEYNEYAIDDANPTKIFKGAVANSLHSRCGGSRTRRKNASNCWCNTYSGILVANNDFVLPPNDRHIPK